MELLSIRNARFIGGIPLAELNPRGLLIYPALIPGLIEKYGFTDLPEEPLDEEKGVSFGEGGWNKIAIDRFTLFSDGVVIDTRSSTKDSEAIFDEGLQWAATTYGLTYTPEMVAHRRYVSEVSFRSEIPLNSLNPKLDSFSKEISSTLNKFAKVDVSYSLTGTFFHYDISNAKTVVAPFKVERLEHTAHSENKYYSVAPLPTEEHLRLIEEFESILQGSN